jgi:1-acyl-sn-glycerol-3-phosphate acyltransferase
MRWLARFFLWITGWKISDQLPGGIASVKKCVLIAAPHTSNWDYPYALSVFYALGVPVRFLAKESLFRFPQGIVMRASGGIPVNRAQRSNLVQTMVDMFTQREQLVLMIPVEGTRSYVRDWKSGFYHVARGANVPIVLGFLDYGKKVAGFHSLFYPTGDYAADLRTLQGIYRQFTPKHPDQYSLHDGPERADS